MKNTHVLPTEKPSRLIQAKNDILILLIELAENNEFNLNKQIYITSDEEIKEGHWCISLDTKTVFKVSKNDLGGIYNFRKLYHKIILTTDQDLIKDGVQAIDDDFLEWFVKNPSCEFVEFDYRYDTNLQPILDSFGNKVLRIKIPTKSENLSQIIIPKEEAKQETLEEAAKKYAESNQYDLEYYDEGGCQGIDVKSFAEKLVDFTTKWQQEQDKNKYSEEDLKDAYMEGGDCDTQYKTFQEWFEQEKKK